MARLAREIKKHDRLYHGEDKPQISDAKYDALKKRYDALCKRFPDVAPEMLVGAPAKEGFAKHRHDTPMLSLANGFSKEEILAFFCQSAALSRLGGECQDRHLGRAQDRRAFGSAHL